VTRPGTVSVAIASRAPAHLLDACLASVAPEAARLGAEVVVARAAGASAPSDVMARYPEVKFIVADGPDVPRLRAAGLAAATGELVALTEDHCVARAGWLESLVGASHTNADVVGGAMDNARRERAVDWAAYFAEYGFFAERSNRGPVPSITGANVAYGSPALDEVRRLTAAGEWENVVHDRLLAQGRTLAFLPTATIYQNQSYRFGAFCQDRFAHGRNYARRRLAELRPGRRWLLLAGTWLLPPLLALRIARVIGPHQRRAFVLALPLTLAFLAAWAAGEAWGYLLGPGRGATTHA